MFRDKLFTELSTVGKLASKLALLFFYWLLNCLFKSPINLGNLNDAIQTNKEPEMFAIKVLQFRSLPVRCECLSVCVLVDKEKRSFSL